jgi:hypothetical protein
MAAVLRRVEVFWIDSRVEPGWKTAEEIADSDVTLDHSSLGYLAEDRPDRVVLVQSLSPNSQAERLHIPRVAITNIVHLAPETPPATKRRASSNSTRTRT